MPANALNYTVSINPDAAHTFDVCVDIPTPDPEGQKLTLPAWIPGSYMIRDFARNIVSITAEDENGKKVPLVKIDKQTFITPKGMKALSVSYSIYAFDRSIRSAYLDDDYGFFNGTSLFLRVCGREHLPHSMKLQAPASMPEWKASTAMMSHNVDDRGFGVFQSENYENFIDHPVLLGHFDNYPFHAAGVDFELIFVGGHQADTDRICNDLKRICEHHINLFDDKPPIERYLFMTILTADGFGGLEHLDSTALMYSRDDLPRVDQAEQMPDGYRTFLSLCSHEFFHTWHVKRIRPAELASAMLDTEQYTEQLWIYEGFTSYYDDISLRWAGLISQESYLEVMGQNLTRLLRNKGRFHQSVTESSFYAWNKFYKQDASAINTIVSYYNKGAVIAMCLDLYLRKVSEHQYCLDDVMRHLWQEHGKPDIGTDPDVIRNAITDVLKLPLPDFFESALYGTDDLPVAALLSTFGVDYNVRPRTGATDKGGKASDTTVQVAFGAVYSANAIGVKITQVIDQSPAQRAGLQIGDVLICVGGWQVCESDVQQRLDNAKASSHIDLHILRDKRLKQVQMQVDKAPEDTVYLSVANAELAEVWIKPDNQ